MSGTASPEPEKLVGSRRVFSGRVVSLRVDTVRLTGGRETTREVVEHPGAVAIVPLAGNDVWMVRQYRRAVGYVLLEIPAGLREPGEPACVCARRELAEELVLQAGTLTHLATYHPSAGFSNELVSVYLAEDLKPITARKADPEVLESVKMTLADALALVESGEILDAKSIIGLLLTRDILDRRSCT